jgi:hypothetical protein
VRQSRKFLSFLNILLLTIESVVDRTGEEKTPGAKRQGMRGDVRVWIGIGLLAAGGCAGSPKLPEEPDTYVAASELSEERAADLAAAPFPPCLDRV